MNVIEGSNSRITFPIALVVSRFNSEYTELLLAGALERLKERDFDPALITVVRVPGAVEIPLAAQKLANLKRYDAVVCLGAVIRGETSHYDYVCSQVSDGCQAVALKTGIPIIFGVLTTENDAQTLDRCGGKHGHKGREGIDAAVEMVSALRTLN